MDVGIEPIPPLSFDTIESILNSRFIFGLVMMSVLDTDTGIDAVHGLDYVSTLCDAIVCTELPLVLTTSWRVLKK